MAEHFEGIEDISGQELQKEKEEILDDLHFILQIIEKRLAKIESLVLAKTKR